jgi:alkaline phosphatase
MSLFKSALLGSSLALLLGSSTLAHSMSDRPEAARGPALTLPQENDPWFQAAADRLDKLRDERPTDARAKNVILFIGDGMGIATVTAARILQGQQMGEKGESSSLIFETFPRVALSKTYTTDYQTPDSAGTATAMVSGVKTKSMVISLDDTVQTSKCGTGAPVMTMMELAELAGLATGVVTTTRLTHATPATNYAHSANRNWESAIPDARTPETQVLKTINPAAAAPLPAACADIASQLIDFNYGDGPEVAMGGGRAMFLPDTVNDPENEKISGYRKDGRDLTQEWIASSDGAVYVWNKRQLDSLNLKTTGRVLGLFEPSHMKFELDRPGDEAGEPSLAEMTSAAIDILSRNDKGFYLMVEGGRIDHAHHGTNAARALTDTIAFSDAVAVALEKVDISETLIIVTADHAHTMSISGYSERGNPILGKAKSVGSDKPTLGNDGKPYTTLTYANGPSAKGKEPRADVSDVDTTAPDYRQQSLVPMYSETHSGEDVGIWSIGPGSQWLTGVVEQNYIFHVMEAATDLRQKAGTN